MLAWFAADARPVRVLFLKVTGGTSGHVSTKTGSPFLEAMLSDPAGLTGVASLINDSDGTGAPPPIIPEGFRIDTIGQGSAFTTEQRTRFLAMLDSIDVLVMVNTSLVGDMLTSGADRLKFLDYAQKKGIVGLHYTDYNSDDGTAWYAYDSLFGNAPFLNAFDISPTQQSTTMTVFQDTLSPRDSAFRLLASGLRSRYTYYGQINRHGNPRAGAHVLFALDESSYTPSWSMGDHPFAWYRESYSGLGGRLWFTELGHEDTLYSQNYFFRRQVYNAIVWAAGYNADVIAGVRDAQHARAFAGAARAFFSGPTLSVSVLKDGPHAVEIRSLDGRSVATRRGEGRAVHEFAGLRSGAVYSVTVTSTGRRFAHLVTIP